ncbi:MFS transporter [Enterobacteriaceae bacterium LUAb1]
MSTTVLQIVKRESVSATVKSYDSKQLPIAIALMFSGLTLAMVAGVPLGMLLANLFGWKIPFYVTGIVATLSGVLLWFVLPKDFGNPQKNCAPSIATSLFYPALIRPYLFTIFAFGGDFIFFLYIEPWLATEAHLAPKMIAIVMGVMGAGS